MSKQAEAEYNCWDEFSPRGPDYMPVGPKSYADFKRVLAEANRKEIAHAERDQRKRPRPTK